MAGIRFLGVNLADGVKRHHLIAYFIAVLISSGYAGAMSILQPGLLQVIGIDYKSQAQITGMLGALQEVIFIIMLAIYGVFADRIGRRYVYTFGLLTTAIGFALYGTSTSITELIVYRVIVAFGSGAMVGMMVTVIADYANNESRGKANGLQGVVATFGAFIPPILATLPNTFVQSGYSEAAAQQATFAIAGCMGVIGAIVVFFGLSKVAGTVVRASNESLSKQLKLGAAEAKAPKVALSYGAAFISRGDLAVTGAFMGLWLVQFGTANMNLSASEAMNTLAVPAIMMVVLGALIGSLLMGWVSDKISRVRAVTCASGLAAVIYCAMFFVSDPTQSWVLGLLLVMGIAEISAFVSSQALVGESAPAKRRGAVIGFFGVAGAVGILFATAGGGALFAEYGPSTPFVVFGLFNFIVFLWSWKVNPASNDDTSSSLASQQELISQGES
ncbi:MFS transporter [Thalassotalea sp. HSM 43]|uniref:MFS transporter n=1 Tax=Thalassotalea sp. HSM 43 TaxID=2552945 RepID=UPI0010807DF1|nr:MFS transporter [Thalassotalea sp. HSM 43]QBY04538.1 MFS transporter [Thalassotalea sp. HSM 43]